MKKHSLNLFDIALITGCLLICGGIAAIYWPAALITAGLLMIGGAVSLYKPTK